MLGNLFRPAHHIIPVLTIQSLFDEHKRNAFILHGRITMISGMWIYTAGKKQ
jgi:hypothetical protein